MRTRLFPSMIALAAMIVLGGCSTGAGSPAESARLGPAQGGSPIPPVKNPRDVTALAARPCELLTQQQARGFGLDLPPKQYDAALGDLGCKWTSTTRDRRIFQTVQIDAFIHNPTLEVAYSKRQGLPFFELTEVAGYPAIVSRPVAEVPHCDIDVRPAERQSVTVSYDSEKFNNNPQQSCDVGKQVAAAVLMNLPPKS